MYQIIHRNTGVVVDERETIESARLALGQSEGYDLYFKVYEKNSYIIKNDYNKIYSNTKEQKKAWYVIRDREAGNTIEAFETLSECEAMLEYFENEDRKDGNYTTDFYEIVVKYTTTNKKSID